MSGAPSGSRTHPGASRTSPAVPWAVRGPVRCRLTGSSQPCCVIFPLNTVFRPSARRRAGCPARCPLRCGPKFPAQEALGAGRGQRRVHRRMPGNGDRLHAPLLDDLEITSLGSIATARRTSCGTVDLAARAQPAEPRDLLHPVATRYCPSQGCTVAPCIPRGTGRARQRASQGGSGARSLQASACAVKSHPFSPG